MTIPHDSATLASLRTAQIDSMVMNTKHALKRARAALDAFRSEHITNDDAMPRTRAEARTFARLKVRVTYLERRLRAAEKEQSRRFGPGPRIPRAFDRTERR